jgi:hypothetical protein
VIIWLICERYVLTVVLIKYGNYANREVASKHCILQLQKYIWGQEMSSEIYSEKSETAGMQ